MDHQDKPLISIAVDGPVSSGKSTLCDALARKLNILHLDTGAMYRAVGLYVLRQGIDASDEAALADIIERHAAEVSVAYIDGKQVTYVNGEDITGELRQEAVGAAASAVSRFQAVRRYLVSLQQQLAREQSLIIDGRDIGTVVLPDAKVKIFLTASPEARARRRLIQLQSMNQTPEYETVLSDLVARDRQDEGRACDPLKPAADAVILDTTGLSFDASLKRMMNIVKGAADIPAKPPSRSLFYQVARAILVVLSAILVPCKVHNEEGLKRDAPYILLANHQSLLDPPLLAAKMKRYEIYFLGKRELTRFKPLGWVFKKLHMIAVSRHESDLAAMRAALQVLRDQEVLGLFPEGKRCFGKPLQIIESGAGTIALRSHVPLLPVLIEPKPRVFRKTHMYVGSEIDYRDLAEQGLSKDTIDQLNARIQQVFWDMYDKNIKKTNRL